MGWVGCAVLIAANIIHYLMSFDVLRINFKPLWERNFLMGLYEDCCWSWHLFPIRSWDWLFRHACTLITSNQKRWSNLGHGVISMEFLESDTFLCGRLMGQWSKWSAIIKYVNKKAWNHPGINEYVDKMSKRMKWYLDKCKSKYKKFVYCRYRKRSLTFWALIGLSSDTKYINFLYFYLYLNTVYAAHHVYLTRKSRKSIC